MAYFHIVYILQIENATKEGGWLEMWSNLHDVAPNDWANAQQQLEYSIKTFNHRQLPPDI